jgi:hypothetical protein
VAAHPRQEAQHHTGYLTFARLVPYASKEDDRGGEGGGEDAVEGWRRGIRRGGAVGVVMRRHSCVFALGRVE